MKVPLTPIRCLHRAMDLYGSKQAIVCGDHRFTYLEFGTRCQKLADALRESGVKPGDRVAFLSFNTHRLLEGYFGAPMAHAVAMPLNVRLTAPELAAILRHAEPRILFYERDFLPLVEQLRAGAPQVLTLDLEAEYEELISTGRAQRANISGFDEDAMAELFYTSGSTGTPKGVMLSHRTLYLHAMAVAGTFHHDDNAVELHTIPLFHANGWGRPQSCTMMGLKQVMVRRFDPAGVLRLIQEERATGMSLVPTMAGALLACPSGAQYDVSSMEEIHLGGAAASPQLIERLEGMFRCKVLAGYGLTETAPVASSSRHKGTVSYASEEDRLNRLAMAGWPLPGTELRVVDSEMKDVPRDLSTVGEVVIAGDNVMDGYFRDPEGTAAAMTSGWFHSGDMAVWDAEGYVQIVDRKKDIIISGGENISSIEVENAICAHRQVMEAAVVGAPDAVWGEIPVAFVVTREPVGEEELRAFAAERLAKFKLPRRYVFTDELLPRGGTGKILKRELREKFWEGKSRRVQG